MSLIGIINTDEKVETLIRDQFAESGNEPFSLHYANTPAQVKEVLNYNLPEIVIINLTDPGLDFSEVFSGIKEDLWLHTFGIIALHDKDQIDELEAAQKLKDFNVLAFLDYTKIKRYLKKYVKIIDENQQLIFQFDLADKLSGLITGSFLIDNDLVAVPVYTGLSLATLFQHGFINSERRMALHLVMQELLINAIEHGNCKISFDEKSRFLEAGGNIADLVAEKCTDPRVAAKRVHIEWEIRQENSRIVIRDEGDGFNVKNYKKEFDADPESLHGRGITLAKSLVTRLSYNNKGNVVSFIIDHDKQVMRDTPLGFQSEDVIYPAPGDVIVREGEDSDFLYYISSGTYTASLGGTPVGTIDPGDIFMGEMAFLLNNKRTVTVTANTRGKLVKVSRVNFVKIIREYPHYGIFLSKLIARKLARSNREAARHRLI
ncbi:MAG TPA: cyclic nucleotide-binding domain-containing protein [Spirochaetota bacterium]